MKPLTPEQFAASLRKRANELAASRKQFYQNACQIIRHSREKHILAKRPLIDGDPWPALEPETIARKSGKHASQKFGAKKKGGPSGQHSFKASKSKHPDTPMFDTGRMIKPTIEVTTTEGRVVMAKSRSEVIHAEGSIARILQDVGVGKKNKKWRHWAITSEARRKIRHNYKLVIKELVNKIRNG